MPLNLDAMFSGGTGEEGTLVQRMHALKRSEIAWPADDFDGLVTAPPPPRPVKPAPPQRLSYQNELDQQAQQDAIDKQEMLIALRAKRQQLANSAPYADPATAIKHSRERFERDRRLKAAEDELNGGQYGR